MSGHVSVGLVETIGFPPTFVHSLHGIIHRTLVSNTILLWELQFSWVLRSTLRNIRQFSVHLLFMKILDYSFLRSWLHRYHLRLQSCILQHFPTIWPWVRRQSVCILKVGSMLPELLCEYPFPTWTWLLHLLCLPLLLDRAPFCSRDIMEFWCQYILPE